MEPLDGVGLYSHQHRAYLEQQSYLDPNNNTWNRTNEEFELMCQSGSVESYSQVKQQDKDNKLLLFPAVEKQKSNQ